MLIFLDGPSTVTLSARRVSRLVQVKDISLAYSDNGEIMQVDYAKKAVDRAASVVGITDGRVGVTLSRRPIRSRLHTRHERVNFNTLLAGRLLLCFTGLASDVRYLLCSANKATVLHRVSYGETMSPFEMACEVSRLLTSALHPRYINTAFNIPVI
jgi:20S proteasome alpha/beta subunit